MVNQSEKIHEENEMKEQKEEGISQQTNRLCEEGHQLIIIDKELEHEILCGECYNWSRGRSVGYLYCDECVYGICKDCQ